MEHLSDKEQKELFFSMLAEPEKVGPGAVEKLDMLVRAYPQMGITRALLARAYKQGFHSGFEQKLKSASVHSSDRAVLYNVIHDPEKLMTVDPGQLYAFIQPSKGEPVPVVAEPAVLPIAQPQADKEWDDSVRAPWEMPEPPEAEQALPEETGVQNAGSSEPENKDMDSVDEDQYIEVLVAQMPVSDHQGSYLMDSEQATQEDDYHSVTREDSEQATQVDDYHSATEQDSEQATQEDDYNSAIEEETAAGEILETPAIHDPGQAESEIEDEVFDEITSIDDIRIEQSPFKFIVEDGMIPHDTDASVFDDDDDTGLVLHEAVIDPDEIPDEPELMRQHIPYYEEPRQALGADEEKLILGNIAGADYFAFQDKFPGKEQAPLEQAAPEPVPVAAKLENKFRDEDERVSKYHDDKLPYSFMWWLDKTRREYAGTYQPYAPFNNANAKMMQADASLALQRQYYENIFHLTTIENLDKARAEFTNGKHEDEIIARFIKEEPQIKPPSNDKLDNENKAKKSAEDQDELVSETLARIYLDQMLYHKAITTYKKLLLKFPEKSSYFVAQIQLLERKIN